MYFVYILQSLSKNFVYKGLTSDIDRRLKEHFLGQVRATKHKLPLKLIHVEICDTRLEARSLEKFFKGGYGREIIEEILCSTPTW